MACCRSRAQAAISRAAVLALLSLSLPCLAQDPSPMLEAYQRAERVDAGELQRLVHGDRVEVHWIGETARCWFSTEVEGRRTFVLVDAQAGTRQPAFDHARLAAALSARLGRQIEPGRLPFEWIEFADDGQTMSFDVDGTGWKGDLGTYECVATGESVQRQMERVRRDLEDEVERMEPGRERLSFDLKWRAVIREGNLFVRSEETGEEVQLSTEGSPETPFSRPSWSRDSRYLAACRTQFGDRLPMYLVEARPKEGVRPTLQSHEYALPGDKVDVHQLWLFDVPARTRAPVVIDPIDWGEPPFARWWRTGARFVFEQTYRGYQRVRVVEVDADTGRARTLIDERTDTFIPPQKHVAQYLDATREIIWASERDGWNHLYLYDAETGQVKNRITQGEWAVRGLERVDEHARQIVFTAGGREPGNPYVLHYYRTNLDGTGLVHLTPADGEHEVRFSPDRRFYTDRYSRVDLAPVTELRRTEDGSLVCELGRADMAELLKETRRPESFCAKGRDGKTDIWGVIFRPSNLDESAKYPVIENIYAGPQESSVPTRFSARHGSQALAELGFIVVQIDGMGMSYRSKAFHDVCYKNLADSGFPDRIAWMKAAAAKYPYMDLTRVGIYGYSAGGYNAARALIDHPEFYKVAVAISGNHDHRTDKAWWNELWMGYPVGPHYEEQSNVTQAHRLQGKLLLVHGGMDTNVNPFASTLQFADALIKANKDCDLIIEPSEGHGGDSYAKRRMWDYFVRNLLGVEPPKEYRFAQPETSIEVHVTIRNKLDKPVSVYWVNFEGRLQRYHVMEPGEELTQHTYVGHKWEAQVAGETVSAYTASEEQPVWEITRAE